MTRPGKDGQPSRKQVLRDIYEQTGVLADELAAAPVPPDDTAYLWRWFCEISRGRQVGMGACPLLHGEVDVWLRQRGIVAAEWELQALRALDSTYLAVMSADSELQVGSASEMGA